jgi:hypothetical protein
MKTFEDKLIEATDSIYPHFELNGIKCYVSSKVPKNEVWFISKDQKITFINTPTEEEHSWRGTSKPIVII